MRSSGQIEHSGHPSANLEAFEISALFDSRSGAEDGEICAKGERDFLNQSTMLTQSVL